MASLVAAILIRTHFREHYQPPFTGKECRLLYDRQHTIHALYVDIFQLYTVQDNGFLVQNKILEFST